MSALKQLEQLLNLHHRAAGNTTAALKIAKESKGIFIAASRMQLKRSPVAEYMFDRSFTGMSLEDVEIGHGFGLRGPIVVDHFALQTLLFEIRIEVSQLVDAARHESDEVVKNLHAANRAERAKNEKLLSRIKKLKKLVDRKRQTGVKSRRSQ